MRWIREFLDASLIMGVLVLIVNMLCCWYCYIKSEQAAECLRAARLVEQRTGDIAAESLISNRQVMGAMGYELKGRRE